MTIYTLTIYKTFISYLATYNTPRFLLRNMRRSLRLFIVASLSLRLLLSRQVPSRRNRNDNRRENPRYFSSFPRDSSFHIFNPVTRFWLSILRTTRLTSLSPAHNAGCTKAFAPRGAAEHRGRGSRNYHTKDPSGLEIRMNRYSFERRPA